ncbi:MAG: hypothetical protein WCL02_02425 [bacterium]
MKKIIPYAIQLKIPKAQNFREYKFFSVALIGDVVSILSVFLGIYPKSKVIKYGAFQASIQNAIIIAGKKGMIGNVEFKIQNSELFFNVQIK